MDQISPPMRIALAVVVFFAAAYMLVLRPKDATTEPAAAPSTPATASATDANPASTKLGKAVESARGAAAATEAKQAKEAAATGESTTTAPGTTAAKPATAAPSTAAAKPVDESLAELPPWLQRSIDHKVVAILFSNGRAADDRRTRDALKQAFTAHGKVVKRTVPVARIAKYRPVAQGVDVQQSPTLMVIDRDRQAQALVGFSSVDTINQAIVDALLATEVPVRKVAYLQQVRSECRQLSRAAIIGKTDGNTFSGARQNLDHLIAVSASSLGTLRNAAAPARFRGLKTTVNAYLASQLGIYRTIESVAVGGKTIDQVKARSIARRNDRLEHRAGLELAAVGINACT